MKKVILVTAVFAAYATQSFAKCHEASSVCGRQSAKGRTHVRSSGSAAAVTSPIEQRPIKSPAPSPGWTGFYVGGNIGY